MPRRDEYCDCAELWLVFYILDVLQQYRTLTRREYAYESSSWLLFFFFFVTHARSTRCEIRVTIQNVEFPARQSVLTEICAVR